METDEIEIIRSFEAGMVTEDGVYHSRWIACYFNMETGESKCWAGHEEHEVRALASLYRDEEHRNRLP